VLRVEESDGTVTTAEPEIRFKVKASAEQLQVVADGLAGVVNDPTGTAYWHRPQKVSFRAAGKTGTAQVVAQGADRGKILPYEMRDHAWFVSWAPVDRPRIVVAVINEHGGHGSSAAAPLALELITYYLEQLEPGA
jgi:penicillin-binding protein 2